MERVPTSPPTINPIPKDPKNPIWSVMIPVYNCSRFISAALTSVLQQDLGENIMQIEVIDDGSTDADVEELVNSLGKGRVKYYRQPTNVGSLRNFETCINRSKGELIHILHGDDQVVDGFYRKFSELFNAYPEAGAAFCRYSVINELGRKIKEGKFKEEVEGILKNSLLTIAKQQPTQYAATVVKRKVYEKLGGFYGAVYGEDYLMWVRIAKSYPIAYTPDILAKYRKHLGAISLPKKEDGRNSKDLAKILRIIEDFLPQNDKHVLYAAKLECARTCIGKAFKIWNQSHDKDAVQEMIKIAMNLNISSPRLYYSISKLNLKMSLNIKSKKKYDCDMIINQILGLFSIRYNNFYKKLFGLNWIGIASQKSKKYLNSRN